MLITSEDVQWPFTMFDNTEPRAEGIHLSDVIKQIEIDSGLAYSGPGFTDMELTAEIGLLWEDVLSRVMADKYACRPSQICLDGVWMSPDGINDDPLDEVPMVIEEYKATWKSARRCPSDDFKYMTQIKSYCYAMGTNVAVMRIFYIMGDYKGSGPLYRVSRITFDQRELEINWDMILKTKAKMEVLK